MKRTVWLWQLFGFAVTVLGGSLLHFLYDWTNNSIYVTPISSINESTWEHMKLLFWPMFIFAIIQSFFFYEYKSFWCIKLKGILLGLASIPIIFYTYSGIIGKTPDWVNISIFFAAAALAYFYETKKLNNKDETCSNPAIPFIIISIVAILFVLFTFIPLKLNLFKDPVTGGYGIKKLG